MSLFVARLNPDLNREEFEDAFKKHGELKRCDLRDRFGFVTFENDDDAQKALDALDDQDVGGCHIRVEWSKQSSRYSGPPARSGDVKCYNCEGRGHIARNCPEQRRARSRSRSPRRDRDRRRRRYSRSRSRSYSRSRSPPRRRHGGHRRSVSRSVSRSRSPRR